MGTTTNLKLPWPELTDAVDGPGSFEDLAQGIEDYFFNRILPAGITRSPVYHWGSGASFPARPAIGDTFTHTALGPSLMRWNGAAWRQVEPADVASVSARNVISINQSALLHPNFQVRQTDTGEAWRWDGASTWQPASGTLVTGKAWRTGGPSAIANTANAGQKIDLTSSRVSGGVSFDATNDLLVLPMDGMWEIKARGGVTASAGAAGFTSFFDVQRSRSGVTDALVCQSDIEYRPDTQDRSPSFGDVVPLRAGDALYLRITLLIVPSTGTVSFTGTSEVSGCMLSARWLGPLTGATAI